jgi:hypothetical protein
MSFFVHVLNALRAMLPALFWLIWTTITAAAAICVAFAVGYAANPTHQKEKKGAFNLVLTWRRPDAYRASAAIALLTVFLGSYVTMSLVWEDFAYYDNSIFTLFTLKGHDYPIPIWRGEGRFFPLGHQEFNLVRHFTDTIAGYHVLPIAQLLIFFCILFLIFGDELSIAARGSLTILILVTPSILISFTGLILPERNILFFLACLFLLVKRFEQTKSVASAMAAVLCAQMMLYYKEPAFLLLLGFAGVRLMLRLRNVQNARWDYARLWDAESSLDLCFVSLAVLFLLLYFRVMGFHNKMHFADVRQRPSAEILLSFVKLDLLAYLFVSVVVSRIYCILRDRAPPSPLWDGLALGGVAYFLAYLYLGIFHPYYSAPVDLIAVAYTGRLAVLSWKKIWPWGKPAAVTLALVVVLQDISLSAYEVFERKNIIHAKVAIADVVETQYRQGVGNAIRLFFPFANPWVIEEFAAYLSYRGVPVEGYEDGPVRSNNVVLAGAAIAGDGQCVDSLTLRCHASNRPEPGDLVIVFPDDEASLSEAAVYRQRGELLLSYQPRPPIPHWLYLLVGNLRLPASGFAHRTLPDRWMDSSVTTWD